MELILVLALLVILSVAAIPVITNTQTINLDGAARKLEADLRYAQNLATTTGDDYGLRSTPANGADGITGYEVYNVVSGQPVTSPYDHLPMTESLTDGFSGVAFGSAVDIRFDEQGDPTNVTGNGTISLENEDGDSKDIVVSSTGLINIQ